MNKRDYLEMLVQDNQTTKESLKKLYNDVIDCTEIALSQMPESFQIQDTSIGLKELFAEIEKTGKTCASHCVGPFEAAELIAKKLGATFVRASMRVVPEERKIVKLEDLL